MTIGLILAGGKSQRFQQDKALFWDERYQKTWVQLAYDKMLPLTEKVFISTRFQQLPALKKLPLAKAELILDPKDFSQKGPLSGILGASLKAPTKDFLILGVDYPHFSTEDLKKLLAKENVYAQSPTGQGHYTSAHLHFSTSQLLAYLADSNYRLQDFYKTLNLTPLTFPEESLINYNYPLSYH